MAYVLGFIYADGALIDDKSSRGKYLAITSTDRDIIDRIKRWLRSDHTITIANPPLPHQKIRYSIKIGNKFLYHSLTGIGLCQNKSLTIGMPVIPASFLRHFVRGYFDGDGCVYLWRTIGKNKIPIIRKLSVIFTSGSEKFLEQLCALLQTALNIKQSKVYKSHRSYQLRMATKDSLKMYNFMYRNVPEGFFFKRKLNIFREYFAMKNRVA
ncbi:MAG: LAGLIDADG family homing endonuclease [bacterium]|nr:LAGLIDADG family homing endonuclease [bacterium]